MEFGRRPNRSDFHLPREEAAKLEGETKEYFDNLAPKRHTKPQRSDHSSQYVDAFASNDNSDFNPENDEFQRLQSHPQRLQSHSQKLVYTGSKVPEEFVETEYYKDLNCVDKQHHMTGTGFIKMENANSKCLSLALKSSNGCHASCKGNPATNDWIPSANDMVNFSSDKPQRSDN